MTTLSPQQDKALDEITKWYSQWENGAAGQVFKLTGPAGTGKTTLAREVKEALQINHVFFAAYTGKAAQVLRSKGCQPASTLHSLIYVPEFDRELAAELRGARDDLEFLREMQDEDPGSDEADFGDLQEARQRVAKLEAKMEAKMEAARTGTPKFEWNPDSPLEYADLLILDEVSMVSRELAVDVERYGTPVLVLGDREQLEPVAGEGHYLRGDSDFHLDEIHRQALDSPVLELATRVRTSTDAKLGCVDADFTAHDVDLAMEHDQILCWKNSTRWYAINKIRAKLRRPAGKPVPGDRIMCLTNNRTLGVFNGQQWTVLAVQEDGWAFRLTLMDDDGQERTITTYRDGFAGMKEQAAAKDSGMGGRRGQPMLATFAQAITVHKSQGSEWGSVYVVNETRALMNAELPRRGREGAIQAGRRLLYTAITRASERVTLTAPRGR